MEVSYEKEYPLGTRREIDGVMYVYACMEGLHEEINDAIKQEAGQGEEAEFQPNPT